MFGFGIIEFISIIIIILLLFRPRELPTVAREILRWIHAMKRIYHQIEKEWNLTDPNHPPVVKKINNEDIKNKP